MIAFSTKPHKAMRRSTLSEWRVRSVETERLIRARLKRACKNPFNMHEVLAESSHCLLSAVVVPWCFQPCSHMLYTSTPKGWRVRSFENDEFVQDGRTHTKTLFDTIHLRCAPGVVWHGCGAIVMMVFSTMQSHSRDRSINSCETEAHSRKHLWV